jgi:competence protein ComEC
VRLLAPLVLLILTMIVPACTELELLLEGSGPGPPPSGSLSVGFIDVGQGDGVLVQAGGESYLRSRGVESLDGIVVTNPRQRRST